MTTTGRDNMTTIIGAQIGVTAHTDGDRIVYALECDDVLTYWLDGGETVACRDLPTGPEAAACERAEAVLRGLRDTTASTPVTVPNPHGADRGTCDLYAQVWAVVAQRGDGSARVTVNYGEEPEVYWIDPVDGFMERLHDLRTSDAGLEPATDFDAVLHAAAPLTVEVGA